MTKRARKPAVRKVQKVQKARKESAADLHERARVLRRSGGKPEAVRVLTDAAAFAERSEAAR